MVYIATARYGIGGPIRRRLKMKAKILDVGESEKYPLS